MTPVSLAALSDQLGCQLPTEAGSVQVSGVSQSHKRVQVGDVFVASQGANSHGIEFLDEAIAAGAVAVVTDRIVAGAGLPQLQVIDPKSHIGAICNLVYPPIESRLWAVTGTNGKTSTATYLYRLLALLQRNAALSGSTGMHPAPLTESEGLTTPEADVLHRQLRAWQSAGMTEIVLEVSAQALTRHRVDGLRFAVSGFTNLSHDHLDEYGDMQRYLEAKAQLFTGRYSDSAVISTGDEFGRELFDRCSIGKAELALDSITESTSAYQLAPGPDFLLRRFGGTLIDSVVRPGSLMARNLALAVSMLLEGGFSATEISRVLPKLDLSVSGRLQRVEHNHPQAADVFLDYAHTPAAIAEAISDLRSRGYSQVTVVFSASGDRDHSKRPDMARAASTAEYVIVTDFHPRGEAAHEIRAELIRTLSVVHSNYDEVPDPAQAIKLAIIKTQVGDAVLWCGPGHLKYREVAGKKVPFDPESAILAAVEELT